MFNKIKENLENIYSIIPEFDCKNCHKCCNNIIWFEPENIFIKEFLKKNILQNDIKNQNLINNQNICPFLIENRCVIYPVRPIVCRLQGNIEELPCHLNKNNDFMNVKKLNYIRNKLIYLISKTNGLDYFYSSRNINLRCLYKDESRK